MIVLGVALFMGFGDKKKKEGAVDDVENMSSSGQLIGILLLFVSLCFDGGTGAYEDKLMSVHQVQPFDLMFNIQLGKTILAGIGLLVFNQLHIFLQMVQDMGFLLVGLGLTGALGQVFIFVTIAKFGALTCSIIGLARKVTTLVASIYFYGHSLNSVQVTGLAISVASMVMDFMGKQKKGGSSGHHGEPPPPIAQSSEELEKILGGGDEDDEDETGDVELASKKTIY
jgi:solute carrier family 35 (UDP-galactose transporter), member B1